MAAMSRLASLVDRMAGRRMVVLGDLAVDCFVETRPIRMSREAPVPVLRFLRRHYAPGGAAHSVMNLRALGAEVVPIGIVGDDEAGAALLDAFRAAEIPPDGLVVAGRSVVQVRLTSGGPTRAQRLLARVDMEPDDPFEEDTMLELVARAGAAEDADGVVVCDYGYAAASPGLWRAVTAVAPDACVSVDTRFNLGGFDGVDLLTPNEWEAGEFFGYTVRTDGEAADAARELRDRHGVGAVILSRGNRGLVAVDEDELVSLPAAGPTDVVDPCGAGDAIVATAALARACGATAREAAELANVAAGLVVMRAGARGPDAEELRAAVS